MTTKPATIETINRRSRAAARRMGAPTKREIAAQQAAMDAEFARQGRIEAIRAEQQDEMAAARARAAARMEAVAAESALAFAAIALITPEADERTLEDVAREQSNLEIRFRVWRGQREVRVYCEYANGSRNRPWIQKGYYRVDEEARTSKCECDRRGPVEAFEAALAEFLAR